VDLFVGIYHTQAAKINKHEWPTLNKLYNCLSGCFGLDYVFCQYITLLDPYDASIFDQSYYGIVHYFSLVI